MQGFPQSNDSSSPVAAQKEGCDQKEGVGAGGRYLAVLVHTAVMVDILIVHQAGCLFRAGLKTPVALGTSSRFTPGGKAVLRGATTAKTLGMRRGWHHGGGTFAVPAVYTFFFLPPAQALLRGTGCSVLGAPRAAGRAQGSHFPVMGMTQSPCFGLVAFPFL